LRKRISLLLVIAGVAVSVAFIVAALIRWPDDDDATILGFAAGSVLVLTGLSVLVIRLDRHSRSELAKLSAAFGQSLEAARQQAAKSDSTRRRIDALSTQTLKLSKSLEQVSGEIASYATNVDRTGANANRDATRLEKLLNRALGDGTRGLPQQTRRLVTRDVSALLNLHGQLHTRGDMPASTSFVATPETILALVALTQRLPDGSVVVETGSGLSTVWLALAIEHSGRAIKLVSLEHEESYLKQTAVALDRQDLLSRVDLRFAPLEDHVIDGVSYPWYAKNAYEHLTRIDLLFVDGPPARTGANARFPAFPLLEPVLAKSSTIVLDDTDRDDERNIIDLWAARAAPDALILERTTDRSSILQFSRASGENGSSGARALGPQPPVG
jgi:predicted O-methyltransferase YrrM